MAPALPTRKRARLFTATVTIALCFVLLAVGLGSGFALGVLTTKSNNSLIDITETGSTLLEPLIDIWGPNYTKLVDSHVIISPSGGGSGVGQAEAEAGAVDIGASDAYTLNNLGIVDVPVAVSSQLIVYDLGASFAKVHLNLNGTILAGIYEGSITTWNNALIQDANPKVTLPDTGITPVFRSDSSGDTYLFTSFCDMSDPTWSYGNSTGAFQGSGPSDGASAVGNIGIVDDLNNISGSIGYVGISYRADINESGKLGTAALGNNLANSYAGGDVKAFPAAAKNYINWSMANVSQDAALGLAQLSYAKFGLAVSLILGGSPSGAITWALGGGGTNPTGTDPTPYPIVNLEYTLIKQKAPHEAHEAYVVQFEQWAISAGNAPQYLDQVGFLPLTVQLLGLDEEALATVTTDG